MAATAPLRSRSRTAGTAVWAAISSAITLPLVAWLYIGPVLPLALPLALAITGLAAFRPKAFALLAVVVIMLSTVIQNLVGQLAGYADEGVVALAVAAFCTRRLVTTGRLVWLPGSGWFAGFLVLGLLSSVAAGVAATTTVQGAFIVVKGVLFALALAQLDWTVEDIRALVRWGAAAVVAVALAGLANLAAPVVWAQLTTGRPPINFVGAIPALNGIFQHPAAFSRFCGVLAVGCLAYWLVVRRTVASVLLMAISGGLAFLTFQVKSIVGLLATLAAVGARFLRPVGAASVVALGPLVALIAVPPLVLLVGGDFETYVLQDSARSLLTEGGAAVAWQYFPLGAGFGMYGSSTAAENYSPLYYSLGFADRYGLGPERATGQYLNDTQWPAIFGEAGWIGAFCFAAGLLCMLVVQLRRVTPEEDRLVRWIRVAGAGWMVLLLVESVAAPVFVSSPSFPFVFAAAGIVASLRVSARDGIPTGVRIPPPRTSAAEAPPRHA